MEELSILQDLLVVFAVAGVVMYVFQRVKVPGVVGLLLAGLLVGPYGLGLVGQIEEVKQLAEIGVVVLLFAVGLEFSLSRLLGMWRVMLAVGLPQVLGCIAVTAMLITNRLGGWEPAVFVGMLVAMSSTAVVLKVLNDQGELSSPQGRLSVAVLLLQDLMVTVFMLTIPLLSPAAAPGASPLRELAAGIAVVALVLIGARYVLRPALFQVVRTRNRELFLIFIFLVCIGTAVLTASAGLSLALGAFLAGLALSESEYAHQMFTEVVPFRDTLSSLFFISVGMLLDLKFLYSHLGWILTVVLALVSMKSLAAGIPTLIAGYPLRIAVLTGLALAQVGEFSFVLASRGMELGLLDQTRYQTFLAASVLTMVLTPFLIKASPTVADRLDGLLWLRRLAHGWRVPEKHDANAHQNDHVIIVGYGLGGQNLALVLQSVEVPYVILELNPEAVRNLQAAGVPIFYGDCTRPLVLEHLGIQAARVMVLVISDPAATRRAVQVARQLNPKLHIVVRTRFISEIDELKTLGANEIIPEDLVTSVEIFSRVLREYQVPRNQVDELVDRIRRDQYGALRAVNPGRLNLLQQEIAERAEVESCLIKPDSPTVGRTLREIQLRKTTGATVIAVRRQGVLLTNPDADFSFDAGDIVVLFGDRDQVDQATLRFDPARAQVST